MRRQPGEDLVELIIGNGPRNPGRQPRPVKTAAFMLMRLHRVVMRMRPSATTGTVQRERIEHRARAGVTVEVVKATQHRLAMHHHRNRIRRTGRGTGRRLTVPFGPPTPVRPRRLTGHLQPTAEIPGLDTGRPVPRHPDRPQKPEPTQQVHPIRTNGGLRSSGRLQIRQEGRHPLHGITVRVDQLPRRPPVTGLPQSTHLRDQKAAQIPRSLAPASLCHEPRP